mmetsp:Transcript_17264/g.23854  ORF Transcript_17264/g.23854 Transcript_17264/m.23854 type:complete len:251 (+) Transcript_17264:497-1249(+)|eukprot:CAMPEP_0196578358 /NCGR_PEP_ID=MMETSP1081-20130531/7266_1 /TAXON_ID=36882 /ORGANISM="Pyramimonas amylifera, Strain CCMP720" /LENGTH=250 /DNA_ID=CAMNT_0041897555 /DNA_START=494 /DNA_END=1246 /DNA_ORIENTATION=-
MGAATSHFEENQDSLEKSKTWLAGTSRNEEFTDNVSDGEEMVPASELNAMLDMFTAAMNSKNISVEDLQSKVELAQEELTLAKAKEYDEEFLLHELQRILKANAQLLNNKEQLERENKMLQHEGDLVSQQLENVSFYMKNVVMELDAERKQRKAGESQIKDASEGLRALYKEVRLLKALAAEKHTRATPVSKQALALAKVSKRDVKLPGNLAEDLEADFQHNLKIDLTEHGSDSDFEDEIFYTPRLHHGV